MDEMDFNAKELIVDGIESKSLLDPGGFAEKSCTSEHRTDDGLLTTSGPNAS